MGNGQVPLSGDENGMVVFVVRVWEKNASMETNSKYVLEVEKEIDLKSTEQVRGCQKSNLLTSHFTAKPKSNKKSFPFTRI